MRGGRASGRTTTPRPEDLFDKSKFSVVLETNLHGGSAVASGGLGCRSTAEGGPARARAPPGRAPRRVGEACYERWLGAGGAAESAVGGAGAEECWWGQCPGFYRVYIVISVLVLNSCGWVVFEKTG